MLVQKIHSFGPFAMLVLAQFLLCSPSHAGSQADQPVARFATFNVSFFRQAEGELAADLDSENDPTNPKRIAEIIQRIRPDVLLLNEFDYDSEGKGAQAFQKNFLAVSQGGQEPIEYAHVYFASVNTGVDSGLDLDANGSLATSNDCFGFGNYPGQYGMLVLSRYPINQSKLRTFQKFLWKDMPNHLMP